MKNIVIFSDDTQLRDLVRQIEGYQVLYLSPELIVHNLPDKIDLAIFDFDVVPLSLLDEWSQFPRLHIRKMAVVSAENVGLVDDILEQLDNYIARPFNLNQLGFRIWQIMKPQPSDVIPNMSFELRTPLTPIMGYARLLSHYYETNDEPGLTVYEKTDYLNQIFSSGQRLESLILSIFNMIEVEQIKNYYFQTQDIVELVNRALKFQKNKLSEKSQSLNIYNPDETLKIHCDIRKIDFVLDSILQNASQHSEDNSVIDLFLTTEHEYVLLTVRDHGAGVSKDIVDDVFTRKRGYNLYLCKQIIEMHSGNIWFESEVGVGTTFYFTLPLAE